MKKNQSKLSLLEKQDKKTEREAAKRRTREQRAARKCRTGSQTSELEDGAADGYELELDSSVRSRKNKSGGARSSRTAAETLPLPGVVDDGNHSDTSSDGPIELA